MKYNKKKLLQISYKVAEDKPISPDEINYLLSFTKITKEHTATKLLKQAALPGSLLFGFLFTTFPVEFEQFVNTLPSWTNFNPPLLSGVNYIWDLLGDPVKKANFLYHIPNIILYSFGIFGIKKLIDLLDRKTWLEKVVLYQTNLRKNIDQGNLNLKMKKGHSILFVGNGDYIGMQHTLNLHQDQTITISSSKPTYTNIWNNYDVNTLFDNLKDILIKSDIENAGEYVFFPVKDDQIFLPNERAYDLSPHKLDLLVQNIRTIEKELNLNPRRIIIIGDKSHMSYVHSEDQQKVIAKTKDIISLTSIANKYPNMTLLDPSDIVLKEIIKIAKNRKIVFRATLDGIKEYKKRFYTRLKQLGYKQNPTKKGILTIGYDLFEDQTEQQTLSRKIDDLGKAASSAYYPVVLSKNVSDALIRNGYKPTEFLYVPDLVLNHLLKTTAQQ